MPLKLTRRPKSPYWIMRGTVRGIRVEESTGTDNKKVAEEIRAKREAELLAQSVYGRRATATFAEAALSYLENGGDKRFLDKVLRYFATTPLGKIDQDAIDVGARKVYPNVSDATRDRQFYTPASAVIKHAAKRGWCSQIIMERPDKPPGRVRWLTPEQANQLINACNDYLRALVIFLFYTGARIGEALWLDWRDVDLNRSHVIFPVDPSSGRRTKNNEARGVPLHPRVCAALANLPHREGEVFRRPDGMPYARLRDNETSAGDRIKKAFAGACKRAGIQDFTPHDCRHTWATWHYAKNRDLLALQRLGGWKTLAMVTRYAHVNVGELAHTIDNLPWTETGGNLGDRLWKKRKQHDYQRHHTQSQCPSHGRGHRFNPCCAHQNRQSNQLLPTLIAAERFRSGKSVPTLYPPRGRRLSLSSVLGRFSRWGLDHASSRKRLKGPLREKPRWLPDGLKKRIDGAFSLDPARLAAGAVTSPIERGLDHRPPRLAR